MLTGVPAASPATLTATVYVGSHYEVRDHDRPTKYIFNGLTRVASITGSLSTNSRVQRIRLDKGWNLISVAVTAANLAGQLGQTVPAGVDVIYEWTPFTGQYALVVPGQTIPAGSVLWVKAETNFIVAIVGTYSDPVNQQVTPGGAYIPGSGLEAWTPSFPVGVSGWFYESPSHRWTAQLPAPLVVSSGPPWILTPGQAMFVSTEAPIELTVPDPTLRIRYYHQDHLGSSSVITDQAGNLVEELAFYPFGHSRNDFSPRQIEEPYEFTQKERDTESGLDYFGKRFYAPTIGRWISPDPLQEGGGGLNLYAYVNQRPLNHFDPDGAKVNVTMKETGNKRVYHIDVKAVIVNTSSHPFSKQELETYAHNLENTIKSSYSGSATITEGRPHHQREVSVSWSTTVSIEVIEDPSKLKKDDPRHVFRVVDTNVDPSGRKKPEAAGTAVIGGRIMNIEAGAFTRKEVDESIPGNKGYARAYESPETIGAHELGHDLGLPDIHSLTDQVNLMSENRLDDSAVINVGQIQTIYQQFKSDKLNRSDEELMKQGKAVH